MSTTRRLLGLLRPQRRWVVLAALAGATTVGAGVGLIGLAAYLIARASVVASTTDLGLAITGVRFFAVVRAASRYGERYVGHMATFRVLTDLRVWCYRVLEPLAPAGLADRHSGDLATRASSDVDTLQDLYLRVVVPPLAAAVAVAVASAVLGALDLRLGLVLAAFLVLTGAGVPLAAHRLARAAAAETVAVRAELGVAVVDLVHGADELVAYGHDAEQRRLVEDLTARLGACRRRVALARAAAEGAGAGLTVLAAVTVLALAVPGVEAGWLAPVALAVVPLVALAAFEAVTPLGAAVAELDRARAAGARLFELDDAAPPVSEPNEPAAPPASNELAVRGVRFAHGPGSAPVLDGVDLVVPEASTTAVVGPSGAGKSTLLSLLVRFRAPDAGTITVGGVDVADLPGDEVRRRVLLVAQQDHLFDTTVADNLRLADADADDEALVEACRAAHVHDVVAALPDGYATRVGRDGARLSGGERQRLLLARAVLADPPVLLLDEPVSHLEPGLARRVLDDVLDARAGRATVVVVHDIDLVPRADQVLHLGAGRSGPQPARAGAPTDGP